MSKVKQQQKSYGWCQNQDCKALVFGSLKCHKCSGGVKVFCTDMELIGLKQQRDDLLSALKRIANIEDERYTYGGFDLEVDNISKAAIAKVKA